MGREEARATQAAARFAVTSGGGRDAVRAGSSRHLEVRPLRVPAPGSPSFAVPGVVVRLYDLERFGAEVLMDTLRTHPGVTVGGLIHGNSYYIESGKLVAARG